jgi:hypothetical protein
MGVHRLGANELAAARRATLGIKLHDPGLYRHAAGAGPHAVRVPIPGVPLLQDQGHRRAPAARNEPAASLPGQLSRLGSAPARRMA